MLSGSERAVSRGAHLISKQSHWVSSLLNSMGKEEREIAFKNENLTRRGGNILRALYPPQKEKSKKDDLNKN